MVTLKSKHFTNDKWSDQFLEFYSTSFKGTIKVIRARLKRKFDNVLLKLKRLSEGTNNRGFFSQCYKECLKLATKVSIFSFIVDPVMSFKIDTLLLFLKSTSKSFKRNVTYSSDGEMVKLETNDFIIRDLANFLMERTDFFECVANPDLKLKYLNDISQEIWLYNNLHFEGGGGGGGGRQGEKMNVINDSPTITIKNESTHNIANLFMYYNDFICKLFPGFNLVFVDFSSVSSLSLAISCHESSCNLDIDNNIKNDCHLKMFDISLFKQSCRTQEIFNNFVYGGLCVRARPYIRKNDPIRPATADSYDPVNSIFFYDVKGMYSSVLKDCELASGILNHYEISEEKDSLHLVHDMTLFYSEFKSIFFLIWKYNQELDNAAFYISNIFSNYNGNGCIQIDRNQFDLTIIIRRRKDSAIFKILFINIHHWFTHTCDRCSFITCVENGCSKSEINESLVYKGKKSYGEVYQNSRENDEKILEMTQTIKNAEYVVYHSCCQLKNNLEKWGNISNFFKKFQPVQIYNNHFLNPPKKFNLEEVIRTLSRCESTTNNDEKEDEDEDEYDCQFRTLINAFYVVKLNTIEEKKKEEDDDDDDTSQFGYIIGKSCIECAFNNDDDDITKKDARHHLTRTTASRNSYSYVMVDGATLRFLLMERNVEVESLSHIFTYIPTSSLKPFVNKILEARQDSINKNSMFLSKSLKLLLNALIGRLQLRTNMSHNNKTEKNLFFEIPKRFTKKSRLQNDIVNVSYAGKIFNKTVHYVTVKKLLPTRDSFYFKQGYFINGIKILQASKKILLKLFNVFDKYFDGKKYSYLLTHTDSIILAGSLNEAEITPSSSTSSSSCSEAIFSILKPEFKHLQKQLKEKYFSCEKDKTLNYLSSFGKLVLQKSIVCNKSDCGSELSDFIFLAPMDNSYSLHVSTAKPEENGEVSDDDDHERRIINEDNIGFVKGVRNVNPNAYLNNIILSSEYKD